MFQQCKRLGWNGVSAVDTPSWARSLEQEFPRLSSEGFTIIEQATSRYNCIAYAAGNTTDWWWPDGIRYWPPWATVDNRIASLKELFVGLEYEICDDSSLEEDYEKVALYELLGKFEHAALQIPTGRWRSKMGQGPVIEHLSPESLADGIYGSPTVFMRRPANNVTIPW